MRDWLKRALSDNDVPSSSRVLTVLHSFVASFVLLYSTIRNGNVPDGTICAGLGAFATVHYFVNRSTTAFGRQKDEDVH